MNTQEHNGWTNYETWIVNIWMDNEQGSQDYWRGVAQEILHSSRGEPDAETDLALALQEQHEEALPELTGFASDLLTAAMSEVNWGEIAHSLIEAVKEEESHAA